MEKVLSGIWEVVVLKWNEEGILLTCFGKWWFGKESMHKMYWGDGVLVKESVVDGGRWGKKVMLLFLNFLVKGIEKKCVRNLLWDVKFGRKDRMI